MSLERLQSIGPEIWIAEGPTVSFFGVPYPTRMAVVRLDGGSLWVWSPVELSADLESEVTSLGQVRFLVSPNKLHHLFLSQWADAFPDADVYLPPGLAKRRPALRCTAELTDTPPPSWASSIDQVIVRGSLFMDEVLFFHRASRTCLVGDLIQKFDPTSLKRWQRYLMAADGMLGPRGSAPREWRLSFVDRKAARAAVRRAIAWEPERLLIAHGVWVRDNATAVLRESFSWLGAL